MQASLATHSAPVELDPVVDATEPAGRARDERVHWSASIPFLLVHLTPLLVIVTGVSWTAVVLLVVTFWTRLFFVTAGYHRYFSHRTYKLARVPQFLLAFAATSAAQKGPLWWAGHHRNHHRFADTARDPHTPQKGFWWSHVGWILCERYGKTDVDNIADFAKFRELRFLDKKDWIGPWALAAACFLIGGWSGLVVGFFISTVLLWHTVFLINSLAHITGRRRYATEDTARNSAVLAVLTMGEGWHNNHHYCPSSARIGFFWWEWDPTYYGLKVLSWVGIVKDLHTVPKAMRAGNRVKEGSFDIGMFRASWSRAAHIAATATGGAPGYVGDKRAALDVTFEAGKESLADLVNASLDSAEQLAQASRQSQRTLRRP